ncbi:ABC transporter permease [Flavobacterium ginsengisoli]|uniref:ABC transporter permease n=1 Tax=Flavobacterium ginsengisoli TaxID=871694 RepID=UPI002414D67A|nr:ABC transporter permease [Flavobacterium ginsengisoli]
MKKKKQNSLISLFFREVSLIGKDHSLLLTLLIAPLLYAFFYGSIYINKEEFEVKLGVVDDDHSRLSRLLQQNIDNSPIVQLIHFSNLKDAEEQMYQGNCQGYFYIPEGTETNLLSLKQSNVVLAVNASRFLPSSDLLMSVRQICLTIGAGVRLQYFQKSEGMSTAVAMDNVMPVNLDYRPLFNERSSYGAFLLPGLLALILQQTLLIGLSESVAGERQNLRLREWMNAGVSNGIWGKGLFYLLLFSSYAFFFLNVNYKILDLPQRANGLELGILLVLFIATLVPMAQFIGSLFKSQLVCLQMMAFSTYPIFLITGYSWPHESLPLLLQWLANLLPTTPFIAIYTRMVQSGAGLWENVSAFFHLIFLWIFYSFICFVRIKRLLINLNK